MKKIWIKVKQFKNKNKHLIKTKQKQYKNAIPGWKLHEVTDVKNGIQHKEEGIPKSNTAEHGLKLQIILFTNIEDNWNLLI